MRRITPSTMLSLTYQPAFDHPRRLPNPTQTRGHRPGLSPLGGFAFGGTFVAAGTLVVLIGLRVIEPGGRVNVPYEVLTAIGALFASAGVFIWIKTWRERQAERRHHAMLLRHPDEPALADHAWDPAGARSHLRQQAVRATVIAVFFILFLTPFNYIVFKKDPPWLMQGIVGLFDLVTLYLLWDMVVRWGRAFKFGQAVLCFDRFPYRTNEPVKLTWVAPSGCSGAATGRFTLRAIVEWHETTGRGKSRNTRLVHEQQWSGAWVLESPTLITPGMNYELAFTLLPEAQGTALRAERPRFWELEVALSLPGLDFTDTYLVPIYSPHRG